MSSFMTVGTKFTQASKKWIGQRLLCFSETTMKMVIYCFYFPPVSLILCICLLLNVCYFFLLFHWFPAQIAGVSYLKSFPLPISFLMEVRNDFVKHCNQIMSHLCVTHYEWFPLKFKLLRESVWAYMVFLLTDANLISWHHLLSAKYSSIF